MGVINPFFVRLVNIDKNYSLKYPATLSFRLLLFLIFNLYSTLNQSKMFVFSKITCITIFTVTVFCSCNNNPDNPGSKTSSDSAAATIILPVSDAEMTAKLKVLLKGKYENAWDYKEGMIAVLKDDKYGFCDSTGNLVIPCLYEGPSEFREGVAAVKKDGKYGFIDKTGKELFPLRKYDYIGGFENGLSAFRIIKAGKELYGFVDKTGNEVIPAVYDDLQISWFEGDYAIVKKNGKYGTINKQNATIIPFEYESINDFTNGITTAKKAGKWGVIDTVNKELVPFTMDYETVYEFNSGYAYAEKDDVKGYIDTKGKPAFNNIKFSEAFPFGKDGYAIVCEENGKRYLLNVNGSTLFKGSVYTDINKLENNTFLVTQDSVQGIVDKAGKILLPVTYTSIMQMGSNFLLVVKDGNRYFANYKGEKVAEYVE
jgi:WG containing repeat